MKKAERHPHDNATSSPRIEDRIAELGSHHWDRDKAAAVARQEGLELTDDHWDVIIYLRKYYLENGLPESARILAQALEQEFADKGGNKYLYQLFNKGPVTQGSRLANIRTSQYTTDPSFGSSF